MKIVEKCKYFLGNEEDAACHHSCCSIHASNPIKDCPKDAGCKHDTTVTNCFWTDEAIEREKHRVCFPV